MQKRDSWRDLVGAKERPWIDLGILASNPRRSGTKTELD